MKLTKELELAEKYVSSGDIQQARIEAEKSVTQNILDNIEQKKKEAELELANLHEIREEKKRSYREAKKDAKTLMREKVQQIQDETLKYRESVAQKVIVEAKYFEVYGELADQQHAQQEKTIALLDQHIIRVKKLQSLNGGTPNISSTSTASLPTLSRSNDVSSVIGDNIRRSTSANNNAQTNNVTVNMP